CGCSREHTSSRSGAGVEIDPSDFTSTKVGGATAGLLAVAWALRLFFRRIVKDWRESKGDFAEVAAVETWREEAAMQRARADKAYEERNAAVQELGALRAEVLFLRETVEQLKSEVAQLRRQVNGSTLA